MPSNQSSIKKIPALEQTGAGSYDRILAIYNSGGGNLAFTKQKRATVYFKNHASFESSIQNMSGSGTYNRLAGADLSNIFFPYQSKNNANMPHFYPSGSKVLFTSNSGVIIDIDSLVPFKYSDSASGQLYYRPKLGSNHDGLNGIVSSNKYYGDTETYRDIADLRTLGHRLPMIGVGWGYTTDGLPVPSNSGLLLYGSGVGNISDYKFKGGFSYGYEVDPNDYIAAPIDLRYDPQKNVWTGPKGFWAKVTGSSGVYVTSSGVFAGNGSGLLTAYSWYECVPADNGEFILPHQFRAGTFTRFPAFESNNNSVPDNSVVYFPPKDREDRYYFTYGGSSSGNLSGGMYQYMVYQMVSQNSPGWDFVRGAPVLE